MVMFPPLRHQRSIPRSTNSGANTSDTLVATTNRDYCSTDHLAMGTGSDSACSSPPPYASVETRGGGRSNDLTIVLSPPATSTSPPSPPEITVSTPTEQQEQQQHKEPSSSRALAPLRISSGPSNYTSTSRRVASNEELYSIPRLPPPAPNATALSIPDTVRLFTTFVGIAWCIAVPILWTTLDKTNRPTNAGHKTTTNSLFRGQLTAACGLAALGGILIETALCIIMAKRRVRRYRAVAAAMRRSTRGWCAERGVDTVEVMPGFDSNSTRERVWFRAALMAVVCIMVVLMVLVGFVLQ